ncbi:hypothetical protein BDQ12DRAFT_732098 [Crucibulum laeve]|uniref:DNA 3'-5' helicase n=1 Tax=Crucibulum laeve TaxID=68775 RepID=A0A5C3MC12_9AGAR|nr:hypothetical protein BDQ12DRAFT_732098 [Crucibulum laeve]
MDNGPSFDIDHEYHSIMNTYYDDDDLGLENDYQYLGYDDSTQAFVSAAGTDGYFDDLTDEITNSSPSLPERFVPQRATRSYQQHYDDTIDDFEDVAYQQPNNQHNFTMNQIQHHSQNLNSLPRSSQPIRRTTFQSTFGYQQPPDTNSLSSIIPPRHIPSAQRDSLRGANPRNTHGIRLRPVSGLPDMYRAVFKFGVFNAVQSTCFDDIIDSDENLIISAPTGSGKTVLFELSIIRMLSHIRNTGKSLKCVYMAPTKALCSERFKDWGAKFDPLNIKCCELTGDTVHFGTGVWGDAKKASIIITTGEKWDSLTRNWCDHNQILSQIQLFLVDEVHILNESRGSTLEVVISRMKKRGTSVRFVLVSATVPNIDDVASWIGSSSTPSMSAKVYEFGEEFRPCKLTRHVIGIPRHKSQNDFMFAKILDYKLFAALQQYSQGKPILVFCSTRKGVFGTAEQLMKEYGEHEKQKKNLPWSRPPRIDQVFNDKRLSELASFGIGVHHAGLSVDDRRATEDLYLRKILRILVATSTLAVGVNLPAHIVVIKGVHTFQNNASIEYSDLDIMQMLGRAGRPQFDKDGIAIILCEANLENKYKALVQGNTTLESSLHANLSEHFNSEIGLGTITSIESAKEWLRSSFLFQRIRKNPDYYALGKDQNETWQDRADDVVMQNVARLKESQLIEDGNKPGELSSTEYGDIMSKLYIRQATMSAILSLPERATTREILEVISGVEELCNMKLRASEKSSYNNLRRHIDIRFEMKKIEKTSDKVFLLIQAVLAGISLNTPEFKSAESQPYLEAFGIFRHVARIARAVVEVAVARKSGAQIRNGLWLRVSPTSLMRCLSAKAWEDRPIVLRQIEHLGEKSIKVLAEHGITSLEILRKQNTLRIETLLNRRPPFGLQVLSSVEKLPRYSLEVTEVGVTPRGGKGPVEAEILIECGLADDQAAASKSKKHKHTDMTVVLTLSSDMDFIDFRRIPTKGLKEKRSFRVTVELHKPSQSVIVIVSSETIAGLSVQRIYKPSIFPSEYPIMNTRPISSVEMDMVGLEDDPDFWEMDISDNDKECLPSIKDLTRPKASQKAHADPPSHNTSNALLKQRDKPLEIQVKRLSNGKYECNHSCKDKTKCRHMCCRDGLVDPPNASKKRATSKLASPNARSNPSFSQLKNKASAASKADRQIKQLENIHEQMKVSQSLKLSDRQRLKLESPDQLKRKKRPKPDFGLELTDLKDFNSPSVPFDMPDIDQDDDSLPEPHFLVEAVKHPQTPSSETNYSNSEIDALINSVPWGKDDAFFGLTVDGPKVSELPLKERENIGNQKHVLATPPPSKRRRPSVVHSPPNKRTKLVNKTNTSGMRSSFQCAPSWKQNVNSKGRSKPLFLESSKDEEVEIGFTHGYANQTSNNHANGSTPRTECFSDLEAPLATPALTQTSKLCSQKTSQKFPPTSIPPPNNPEERYDATMAREETKDEFAELDDWLNSGSVDIV